MDNELMNNEFFKKLPEDVKEKLKNCKSEEEAMDILKDNMIEIPPEELKKVSGGLCWENFYNCQDREKPTSLTRVG